MVGGERSGGEQKLGERAVGSTAPGGAAAKRAAAMGLAGRSGPAEDEATEGSVASESPAAARGGGMPAAALAEPLAPEVFATLFREYGRYVASIGTRILGPDGPVDDLVQDVFLAMYQDVHRLREQGALKGWLATVASRLAWRQVVRAPGGGRLAAATMDELAPLESVDASPEDQADVAGLIDKLRNMPVPLRQPWLLRHIEGETLPRIAELCECSQSTVQRRLREATEALLVPRHRGETRGRKQ